MPRTESLPRKARIQQSSEFREVYAQGTPQRGRHVVAIVLFREEPALARVGVVASRKVGGAVQRNRAKRMMREGFRKLRSRISRNASIVLVATRECPGAHGDTVAQEIRQHLERAGLLTPA